MRHTDHVYFIKELNAFARSREELTELLGDNSTYGREWNVQTYTYSGLQTLATEKVVTTSWKLKPVAKAVEESRIG